MRKGFVIVSLALVTGVLLAVAAFIGIMAVNVFPSSSITETIEARVSLESLPDWLPRETEYFWTYNIEGEWAVRYSYEYSIDNYNMKISWSAPIDYPPSADRLFSIIPLHEPDDSSFIIKNNSLLYEWVRDRDGPSFAFAVCMTVMVIAAAIFCLYYMRKFLKASKK